MAHRTFVSFNFQDKRWVGPMRSFFQQHEGLIQGKAVFCENDVSDQGDAAIDTEIRRAMQACDAALFVIGDNCHNSPWIQREAELAISRSLAIVVARIDGTDGAEPPELRDRKDVARVKANSVEIAGALNKVGKTQ